MEAKGLAVLMGLAYRGELKKSIYYHDLYFDYESGISLDISDGLVIVTLHCMGCTSRKYSRHGRIRVEAECLEINNISLEILNKAQFNVLRAALDLST